MIERIIILSGKIKGVAKCERGAEGVMHCEFASASPMDIAVAYDERIVVHKSKRSGEKFTMGVPTARNIGVAILNDGDIIAHGKCGNGLSAAALAAFATEDALITERELRNADIKEGLKLADTHNAVDNCVADESTGNVARVVNADENDNGMITGVLNIVKGINDNSLDNADIVEKYDAVINNDELLTGNAIITQEDNDMLNDANSSDASREDKLETEALPIEAGETNYNDQDVLELSDLLKDGIAVVQHDAQDEDTDTLEGKSAALAADYTQCGKVCAKMLNERFENDTVDSSTPFYVKIADQLKNLFDTYPRETKLEELVHESTWARVPFGDDEYYVVGVISEARQPIFICYGLPRELRDDPCPELTMHAEWLPLDRTNVDGKGYWVMYQDAVSGENF